MLSDNMIPLSAGLVPIVNFQTIKKSFLGLPFTPCNNQSAPTNQYNTWNSSGNGYSQRKWLKYVYLINYLIYVT